MRINKLQAGREGSERAEFSCRDSKTRFVPFWANEPIEAGPKTHLVFVRNQFVLLQLPVQGGLTDAEDFRGGHFVIVGLPKCADDGASLQFVQR